VVIPSEWGLQGHSDADVLVHAIGDALLGALALGDLGEHFPDTNPCYQGISSLTLLEEVVGMVRERGYKLSNLDSVLIAQQPRLAAHLLHMRRNLVDVLRLDLGSISVKVKTAEQLGSFGRAEGIAAYAVCLMTPQPL
jgi:2-C-methyl-D-erythritol 2,4-cyclodiphosphate synthase